MKRNLDDIKSTYRDDLGLPYDQQTFIGKESRRRKSQSGKRSTKTTRSRKCIQRSDVFSNQDFKSTIQTNIIINSDSDSVSRNGFNERIAAKTFQGNRQQPGMPIGECQNCKKCQCQKQNSANQQAERIPNQIQRKGILKQSPNFNKTHIFDNKNNQAHSYENYKFKDNANRPADQHKNKRNEYILKQPYNDAEFQNEDYDATPIKPQQTANPPSLLDELAQYFSPSVDKIQQPTYPATINSTNNGKNGKQLEKMNVVYCEDAGLQQCRSTKHASAASNQIPKIGQESLKKAQTTMDSRKFSYNTITIQEQHNMIKDEAAAREPQLKKVRRLSKTRKSVTSKGIKQGKDRQKLTSGQSQPIAVNNFNATLAVSATSTTKLNQVKDDGPKRRSRAARGTTSQRRLLPNLLNAQKIEKFLMLTDFVFAQVEDSEQRRRKQGSKEQAGTDDKLQNGNENALNEALDALDWIQNENGQKSQELRAYEDQHEYILGEQLGEYPTMFKIDRMDATRSRESELKKYSRNHIIPNQQETAYADNEQDLDKITIYHSSKRSSSGGAFGSRHPSRQSRSSGKSNPRTERPSWDKYFKNMRDVKQTAPSMTQRILPVLKQHRKKKKYNQSAVDRLSQPRWRKEDLELNLNHVSLHGLSAKFLGRISDKSKTSYQRNASSIKMKDSSRKLLARLLDDRTQSVSHSAQNQNLQLTQDWRGCRSVSQKYRTMQLQGGHGKKSNKFRARPFKLKNKQPFMTMKSTKKLTIPLRGGLQTEKRSEIKSQQRLPLESEGQGSTLDLLGKPRSHSQPRSLSLSKSKSKSKQKEIQNVLVDLNNKKTQNTQFKEAINENSNEKDHYKHHQLQSDTVPQHILTTFNPSQQDSCIKSKQNNMVQEIEQTSISNTSLGELMRSAEKQRQLIERSQKYMYTDLPRSGEKKQDERPNIQYQQLVQKQLGSVNDTVKKIQPFQTHMLEAGYNDRGQNEVKIQHSFQQLALENKDGCRPEECGDETVILDERHGPLTERPYDQEPTKISILASLQVHDNSQFGENKSMSFDEQIRSVEKDCFVREGDVAEAEGQNQQRRDLSANLRTEPTTQNNSIANGRDNCEAISSHNLDHPNQKALLDHSRQNSITSCQIPQSHRESITYHHKSGSSICSNTTDKTVILMK